MAKGIICLLATVAFLQAPLPGANGDSEPIDPPVAVEGFSWEREPAPPDTMILIQDAARRRPVANAAHVSLAHEYFRYTLKLHNAGACLLLL